MNGLGPCTTPSLDYPPKFLMKFHHFSISLRDFSFILNFFVAQAQVVLFVLTIGIFIL
jgi:hypothetical protein